MLIRQCKAQVGACRKMVFGGSREFELRRWKKRGRFSTSVCDPIADMRCTCEQGEMTAFAYIGAAIAEIAGCFAFWAWLRLDKPVWWIAPGMLALALFAYLLTLIEAEYAGRTYAAYGGVYIVSAIAWLWLFEGAKPDRWDVIGAAVCLCGAAIILFGPRPA